MEIVDIEIDAYSTNITYANEQIRLYVCFTSPTLVEDFYYASRPVAYAKTYFESIDSMQIRPTCVNFGIDLFWADCL